MRWSCHSSGCRCGRSIALLSVFLVTACGQPATPPATEVRTDEIRSFTGVWDATGNRQTLDLATGQQAAIFKLSGSLMLIGEQRVNTAFLAEVVGFADTASGMQGRSVWTDERGDKVFSELRGEAVGPGKVIEGKFTGGTGRYAGIAGEYNFKWQRVGDQGGEAFTGRVVGLNGWARLGSASAGTPAAAGGRE